MPKARFYAVSRGREGAQVYDTWAECSKNTTRFPGARHKSFPSRKDADDWLKNELAKNRRPPPPGSEVIGIPDDELVAPPPNPRPTPRKSPSKKQRIVIDVEDEDDSDMDIQMLPPASSLTASPSPSVPPPDAEQQQKIELSPEQLRVLKRVKAGENVFFTGSAGTGKSVLLTEIIKYCRSNDKVIGITASTGIASVNIGGQTIHSWAGIGLGNETAERYAGKFRGQKGATVRRWRNTDVLIIDEISMLDGKLFDKLENIAAILRDSSEPFGGIQLILSGDFCQLPPVPNQIDGKTIPAHFAFQADTWSRCVGEPVALTHVFRQKEQKFIDMLNAMRYGEMTPEAVQEFRGLSRKVVYTDGIEPSEIYALRREVEGANQTRLNALPGQQHTYRSRDTAGVKAGGYVVTTDEMNRHLTRMVCQKDVSLKVGAQVMLIKNLEQGHLVNGSVGKVEDFMTQAEAKANMISIAEAKKPSDEDEKWQRKRVEQELKHGPSTWSKEQRWPVVRFTSGRRLCIVPMDFTVENSDGGVEAKRDQVPLILAWALSVHKSQGQTLERVRVDLKSVFEKGQAYVALSRATSLQSLEVLNFDQTKVMAHPDVIEWAKRFRTHEIDPQLAEDFSDDDEYVQYVR